MLFPDVTCTVPESIQKNKEYGLYDVLDMDCMIVFTLFRKKHKIQINGTYAKKSLDQTRILAFVEDHYQDILNGALYSNYLYDGYYYHMTSRKQASPFMAFTLVIREGEPFLKKDLQWLDVYEKLNYQRALIENEALQSSNLHNSLFDSVQFAILALNREGCILRQNSIAFELFHIKDGQEFSISDPNQNRAFQRMLSRALERNTVQQNPEFVFNQKDKLRIFSVSVSPLMDSKNKLSGVVVTAIDKTEKRLLQIEVEQLKHYGFIGEFSMGLAHDIKNPLMIIQGCVRQLPSEYNALKNIIHYQTNRINEVITQFMSVGNFSNEAPSVPLDLNQVLKNTANLVGKYQVSKQLQIHMDLEPSLPLFQAKELHMQQIFSNLILNAIDSIPYAGEIFLQSRYTGDRLAIQIQDNGTGISPEHIPHIFTPYFTTKKNGTGMGLFIVRQLVEEYGGTIHFDSAVGKGTTCTVILPAPARKNLSS